MLDNLVGYPADPLDLDCNGIAGVQKHRWFPRNPDTLWRAGSDEVTRLERHRTRRIGGDLRA